jgi:hypothetical protein
MNRGLLFSPAFPAEHGPNAGPVDRHDVVIKHVVTPVPKVYCYLNGTEEADLDLLTVRRPQIEAFLPGFERAFIERLVSWVEGGHPELATTLGHDGVEERVAGAYKRSREYGFTTRRDCARFVEFDIRLGADFENKPGNEWMKALLETTGLSAPTRLYRIECRIERLAAMAAATDKEEKDAGS